MSKTNKVKVTIYIDKDVLQEAKKAMIKAYINWGKKITLSWIVEDMLRHVTPQLDEVLNEPS